MVEPQQPQETEQATDKKPPSSLEVILVHSVGSTMGATMGAVSGICASFFLPSAIRGRKGLSKVMKVDNAGLAAELKDNINKGDLTLATNYFLSVHVCRAMYVLSATTVSLEALYLLARPETRSYGVAWLATNALSGVYEIAIAIYNRGYHKAKTETAPRPTECL